MDLEIKTEQELFDLLLLNKSVMKGKRALFIIISCLCIAAVIMVTTDKGQSYNIRIAFCIVFIILCVSSLIIGFSKDKKREAFKKQINDELHRRDKVLGLNEKHDCNF